MIQQSHRGSRWLSFVTTIKMERADVELISKFMPILKDSKTQNSRHVADNREVSEIPFELWYATLNFQPKTTQEKILLRHVWTHVNTFRGSEVRFVSWREPQ